MHKLALICLFWIALVAYPEKVFANAENDVSNDTMYTLFEELGLDLEKSQALISENSKAQENPSKEKKSPENFKENEKNQEVGQAAQEETKSKDDQKISENQSAEMERKKEEPNSQKIAREDDSTREFTEEGVEKTPSQKRIRRQIKEDAIQNIKNETAPSIEPKEMTKTPIAAKEGDLKRSYKAYSKNIEKKPCDSQTLAGLLKIAERWQFQKKYQKKALQIYLICDRCTPNNPDTLFYIARLYFWRNKKQKAEKMLKKVLELSSQYTDAAALLIKIYIRERKWKKAEALIAQYPYLESIEKDQATIDFRRKDYEGAEKKYEKILAKNPDDLESRKGLARSLIGQRKFKASKEHYKIITQKEPKNQRNWTEYMYVRSFTNIGILLEGGYTKSKETDPSIGFPVVRDFYTLGAVHIYVPINDRWRLDLKDIYFHQKEEDIYPPKGLNYNVYVYGAQVTSNVLIKRAFKWNLELRFLGARGYNHHAFFPFTKTAKFEPGTSFIYSTDLQFIIANGHIESFITKNFDNNTSELLRTIYIHGGYILHPSVWNSPELECLFDQVFYHDSIRNMRNTFDFWIRYNLFNKYIRFVYGFRQSHFQNVTTNYDSYRRRFRNTLGGILQFDIAAKFFFNCYYEHWWKYTVGLVQPIGNFIFAVGKQRIQADKITITAAYNLRDKLRLEASGFLLYTTLPYESYNVKGSLFWQF